MHLTLDQWKTFTAKFLSDRGVDVHSADWTDIEIAVYHNSGYQGISRRFLLMAAKLIREDNQL